MGEELVLRKPLVGVRGSQGYQAYRGLLVYRSYQGLLGVQEDQASSSLYYREIVLRNVSERVNKGGKIVFIPPHPA